MAAPEKRRSAFAPLFACLGLFAGHGSLVSLATSEAGRAPAGARAPASAADNPDQEDDQVPVECLAKDDLLKRGCARYPLLDSKCGASSTYAAIKNSCFYESESELIPEIQDLDRKEFPREILKRYDANSIARNLLLRVYRQRELPKITDEAFMSADYSFYHRLDLQIAFDYRYLDRIAEAGFLNQHALGHSGGNLDHRGRLWTESTMVGMDFRSADVPELYPVLPKYLYAVPSEKHRDLHGHGYSYLYGSILAVLDDSVRNRTTFVPYDSLITLKAQDLRTLKWLGTDFSAFAVYTGSYFEGQVWGDLSMEDVKYFIVNCPIGEPLTKERIQRLATVTRRRVYSCKRVKIDRSGVHYRPKKLLAVPSSS